jgi:hypothetical protein
MPLAWQENGRDMSRHGKTMARPRQEHGNIIMQEHDGKNMSRTWQEHGKTMARP